MNEMDWVAAVRERCEAVKRGKGGLSHMALADIPRALDVIAAADALVELAEDFPGSDHDHYPNSCEDCDKLKRAIDAYREARKG